MRSTRHVVKAAHAPENGHYSDPPLLVLASLAEGPKHGHAMIEDIEHLCGSRLGPGRSTARLPDWKNKVGFSRSRLKIVAGRIELPRQVSKFCGRNSQRFSILQGWG